MKKPRLTAGPALGNPEPAPQAPGKRSRDADATRQRILKAAKVEFARLGLGGARVDAIAERAEANKRMIYHYFSGKEDLFQAVLEEAYADIRRAEIALNLHELDPEAAIQKLVVFTWQYFIDNPEFLTLINSENLHKGVHLAKSKRAREMQETYIELVDDVLRRGASVGVFRSGIDPMQISVTIAAVGYYYLTNRFTLSILYDRDFMTADALAARMAFNLDTIVRLLRP